MGQVLGYIEDTLKKVCPLTIRRFDVAEKMLNQLHKDFSSFEQVFTEESSLIKQSVENYKILQDSMEILFEQTAILQNQLEQIEQSLGKLKNVEGVIHRRSDRLERCIIHCMPRAELSFEVALAEHCDLNCAGCDHFSPLAKPEWANLEETARDFARLAELFGEHVKEIHLLGGEPLLNPDLTRFFKMARNYFPNATIDLTTNGLKLLNQPEEFWMSCCDNNIEIRTTKYPIALNFEEIEKCASKFGVKYFYFGNTGTVVKTSNHYRLDIEGRQDGSRNFLLCHRANTCIYLQRGRLYTCTVAPTVRHFNNYFGTSLRMSEADSIDIYKANSSSEIMEFLAKPIPFCRYCMVDKTRWNQPWHRSEKVIEEWI